MKGNQPALKAVQRAIDLAQGKISLIAASNLEDVLEQLYLPNDYQFRLLMLKVNYLPYPA